MERGFFNTPTIRLFSLGILSLGLISWHRAAAFLPIINSTGMNNQVHQLLLMALAKRSIQGYEDISKINLHNETYKLYSCKHVLLHNN